MIDWLIRKPIKSNPLVRLFLTKLRRLHSTIDLNKLIKEIHFHKIFHFQCNVKKCLPYSKQTQHLINYQCESTFLHNDPVLHSFLYDSLFDTRLDNLSSLVVQMFTENPTKNLITNYDLHFSASLLSIFEKLLTAISIGLSNGLPICGIAHELWNNCI